MNGAELLVQELGKRGVDYIATLCGHGLDPVDAACRDAGMHLVDVRNEQAAGYIADATGRLTRRVGVCAVSSGVAHANALTGVVNAFFDGAPMLLISGSGPVSTAGMGHFQDLDQVAMAAPVCKYARLVDRAERIPQLVHEAFASALSGTPGPVHLTVPLDVLTAQVNPDAILQVSECTFPHLHGTQADPACVETAAEWLTSARHPLIVAGSGLFYACGEAALADFSEALAIPVVTPIWDRGSVSTKGTTFMGVLGAATGGPDLLCDADLVLMVGAACDYRVGYLQPPAVAPTARVIRVAPDPLETARGGGAHLSVVGNPRTVLEQLTVACKAAAVPPKADWLGEASRRSETFRQRFLSTDTRTDEGIHALDIVTAIGSVLTDDTVLVVDGGNIGQWAHQVLCDRYPGHWLTCGASGVVGFGIPGAMAARLTYPDRPIILLSGDGSIGFTIAELESAARQHLGFALVLADDRAWGIVLTGHKASFGEGITSELSSVDYAGVATAFGARGTRIGQVDEIAPAIAEAATGDVPTLIHVPTARNNPGAP